MKILFSKADEFLFEATDDVENDRVWQSVARVSYKYVTNPSLVNASVFIVAGYQVDGGDLVMLEEHVAEVSVHVINDGGPPQDVRMRFKRIVDRLKAAGFTVKAGVFVG